MLPQAPSLLPHQTPPATRARRPRHPALTVFAVLPAEAEPPLAEVRAPPVHAGAPILAPDPVAEVPLSSAAWRQSRNPTRGPSLFPDADPAVGPLSPVSSGQRRVGPRPSSRAETQPSGHPASWLGRPGVGGRLAQQGHHPHSAGPPVPETVVHEPRLRLPSCRLRLDALGLGSRNSHCPGRGGGPPRCGCHSPMTYLPWCRCWR